MSATGMILWEASRSFPKTVWEAPEGCVVEYQDTLQTKASVVLLPRSGYWKTEMVSFGWTGSFSGSPWGPRGACLTTRLGMRTFQKHECLQVWIKWQLSGCWIYELSFLFSCWWSGRDRCCWRGIMYSQTMMGQGKWVRLFKLLWHWEMMTAPCNLWLRLSLNLLCSLLKWISVQTKNSFLIFGLFDCFWENHLASTGVCLCHQPSLMTTSMLCGMLWAVAKRGNCMNVVTVGVVGWTRKMMSNATCGAISRPVQFVIKWVADFVLRQIGSVWEIQNTLSYLCQTAWQRPMHSGEDFVRAVLWRNRQVEPRGNWFACIFSPVHVA